MQGADTPRVEQVVQDALEDGRMSLLFIAPYGDNVDRPPLTANDARRIIACLENPQFDSLTIHHYEIHNPDVLNVFRDGLPLCTSVIAVRITVAHLENEDLDRLRLAFCNTTVTSLSLFENHIQGRHGGEVLRDLLIGNNTLIEFDISYNPIGPEGAHGLGQALPDNNNLQKLNLSSCSIGNDGLANLLPADGMINNSLLHLDLSGNRIEGADGGRQLTLLLQRFPALKVLELGFNRNLGPLGAHALAPGLAAANHLESLELYGCGLGNDGVGNLILEGQVNTSLTSLHLRGNDIQGLAGGEIVVALAARCTNLDRLDVDEYRYTLSPDQRRRLDLLFDRKRLFTEASALGGSPFSVLFRAVEEAHSHEHGLSAIFIILQNDGDDYFCTANNRAVSGMDVVQSVTGGGKRKR